MYGAPPSRVSKLLFLLAALFVATPVQARCIIVPPTPPHPFPHPLPTAAPLRVSDVDVKVDILDGVATLRWRESIVNPGRHQQEARFVMPLPRGAVVRAAALKVGGQWIEAEVLEAGQARRAYEDIVRRAVDPALIEYLDDGMVRTQVFPVPPGAKREIELTLTLALPEEFGRWQLRLPTHAAGDPNTRIRVRGEVRSSRALSAPYSPTHELDSEREGKGEWTFEVERGLAQHDLQLLLPLADREVTAVLASQGSRRDDGTLLLRLSPGFETGSEDRIPRDLVMVLDTSGSMGGEKIRQAKAALRICIDSLGPEDRFALVTYEADVRVRTEGLARASASLRREALRSVDSIEAHGGTNIAGALEVGLDLLDTDSSRPAYLVLLTDGLPTVGERNTEELRRLAREANARDARLFTFGVGTDVDARLLDALATDHAATSRYVLPGENLEIALGDFALQIAEPVWSDLELRWEGAKVFQTVPQRLPDLFRGQTLTLLARYEGSGPITLVVKGRRGDERLHREFELELARRAGEHGYLPALWAGRRVAWLERELRVRPHDRELKNEIRRLGEEFGLVTSQTSLLMREQNRVAERMPDSFDNFSPPPHGVSPRTSSGAAKQEVRRAARQSRSLDVATSYAADTSETESLRESGIDPDAAPQRVGERRLHKSEVEGWQQAGTEDVDPDLVIHAFSDAWFQLLELRPELRPLLSRASDLKFRLDDRVIQISAEEGVEALPREFERWLGR